MYSKFDAVIISFSPSAFVFPFSMLQSMTFVQCISIGYTRTFVILMDYCLAFHLLIVISILLYHITI